MISDACNPLGGESCLLPWPSAAYLRADPSTPSGFRLDLPIEAMPVNTGNVAIDPAQGFYVGGSLGGIMGNVIMAYDPNLVRGVLAVPGGAWSLLLERSNARALLKTIVQNAYGDPEVYQLNVALFGMAFEPYDPITTAAHVLHDPLFGNPVKNVLMWYSIDDCLVSNIATELVARTMEIDLIGPSVKSPWRLCPGRARSTTASSCSTITPRRCRPTPTSRHPATTARTAGSTASPRRCAWWRVS